MPLTQELMPRCTPVFINFAIAARPLKAHLRAVDQEAEVGVASS